MDFWIFAVINLVILAIVGAGTVLLLKVMTKEVPDDQRTAIFRGGSLLKLAGPGKTIVWPIVDRAIPLAIGDVGIALVEGRAQFAGADVPIRSSVHLESGDSVRIIGFDREEAAVVLKL